VYLNLKKLAFFEFALLILTLYKRSYFAIIIYRMKLTIIFLVVLFIGSACVVKKQGTTTSTTFKFTFDPGAASAGDVVIKSSSVYSDAVGFGFEPGVAVEVIKDDTNSFVTSKKPFFFSVKVPEGNYDVRLKLGDTKGTSDVVIRAECRRMLVNRIQSNTGEIKTVEFTVNVRDTLIRGAGSKVQIKPRERNYLHWDNKLTLEFNGNAPKINSIEIKPSGTSVTSLFLAGNSTVVDQAEEPYTAWGQIIPAYFKPYKVAVANYAESGESLSSFIAAKRFEKILTLLKPGDYVFAEFGHNDQKQKGEGIGAFTSYKRDLKYFVAAVKKKGGIPVLVTAVQRRSFDSTGHIRHTLGDYPEANRQVAKEDGVALIDLNVMSKAMYEAWGPKESIKAFVHFPANTFPGQTKELKDDTHFTPFGAYQVAKIIIKGIRDNKLGLANFFKEDVPAFDPGRPDNFDSFYWPYSPSVTSVKPDGN
jgi:lysophospholipase L1-like esterase